MSEGGAADTDGNEEEGSCASSCTYFKKCRITSNLFFLYCVKFSKFKSLKKYLYLIISHVYLESFHGSPRLSG